MSRLSFLIAVRNDISIILYIVFMPISRRTGFNYVKDLARQGQRRRDKITVESNFNFLYAPPLS